MNLRLVKIKKNTKKTYNLFMFLDNATVVSQYRLGLNQSITVSDYSYSVGQVSIVVSVENKNCVPVVEQQYGDLNGGMVGCNKERNETISFRTYFYIKSCPTRG